MSFAQHSTLDWISHLPGIVEKYNGRIHRTTGMSPKDASLPKNQKLLQRVYRKINNRPLGTPKYAVNDPVRLSRYETIWTRGYEPNFTAEIFFIHAINYKTPIVYTVRDYQNNVSYSRNL